MTRTVVVYFEVDEERAFTEINDGPIPYIEKKVEPLEQSGVKLMNAKIADDDADDPEEAYLVYLLRYAFDNIGSENVNPLTYEDWRKA